MLLMNEKNMFEKFPYIQLRHYYVISRRCHHASLKVIIICLSIMIRWRHYPQTLQELISSRRDRWKWCSWWIWDSRSCCFIIQRLESWIWNTMLRSRRAPSSCYGSCQRRRNEWVQECFDWKLTYCRGDVKALNQLSSSVDEYACLMSPGGFGSYCRFWRVSSRRVQIYFLEICSYSTS